MNGVWTVAEMQVRELARRRVALGLLIALPLVVYLSIPAEETWSLSPGAVGLGWSVGGAAMFAALGWQKVDPRLALAGHRPAVQLAGRALPVGVFGLTLGGLILPLLLVRSAPPDAAAVVVAVGLTVIVGVPLGLAIGAVMPREMEAMLTLILVGGVAMSMPADAPGAQVLPLWGPVELIARVMGGDRGDFTASIVHAVASAAALTAVTWVAWRRRVHVRATAPPTETSSNLARSLDTA